MKENRYIAALEIGSSKITGAAGIYSEEDHTLEVLAVEQEASRDSVRYGIIQNPEEVAARVVRIIENLNSHPAIAPRRITGVFVGLSGRSMRSIPSEVKLIFPEETEITGEMLGHLKADAKTIELEDNLEILDIVPRSYHVDGLETTSPKGAIGKSITAVYDIIVGRQEIRRNIIRAITDRAGIEIKGMIFTQLAVANVVLSDEEKRLGCMLVDFGAETTSVSIFRKGALCYFATIPLGGRNITRDLTTLSILEERAEEIKCESGRAVARETPSNLNLNGIKLSDVSNLVVARAEEIVANVIQQITYADIKEKDLPGGIICVGAGSYLNGILELLENQSTLNARKGVLSPLVRAADNRTKKLDTIQTAAILYAGALRSDDDCMQLPPREETEESPEPAVAADTDEDPKEGKVGGFFSRITSKITNIFASPVDDESELE